jgi:hypothetical protein
LPEASSLRHALSNANTGASAMSFNNGAGPGVRVAVGAAGIRIIPAPPEPEASRRGCPARDQAQQRGGPESEQGERMTRVPSTERIEMGATRADLSLGVCPEMARPALRPRLAGESRHLHKKQVPRAREVKAASWLPRESTHSALNFSRFSLFPCGFILSIIVGLLSPLRVG